MKSAILIAVGAFALSVSAQTLPACGNTCVTNMLGKFAELGCAANDDVCLCKNVNFGYGIRDCSNAVCGPEVASTVIAYGNSFCSSATAMAASGSATGSAAGGAGVSTTGTGEAGAGGSPTAITTSAIVSVETSGGSTFTTTVGSTTIFGNGAGSSASGAASSLSGAASSAASGASSLGSSASGAISSANSVASSLASKASSAGSAASHAATSTGGTSSSSAGGARQTAFAGVAAAAGLAALIL